MHPSFAPLAAYCGQCTAGTTTPANSRESGSRFQPAGRQEPAPAPVVAHLHSDRAGFPARVLPRRRWQVAAGQFPNRCPSAWVQRGNGNGGLPVHCRPRSSRVATCRRVITQHWPVSNCHGLIKVTVCSSSSMIFQRSSRTARQRSHGSRMGSSIICALRLCQPAPAEMSRCFGSKSAVIKRVCLIPGDSGSPLTPLPGSPATGAPREALAP